MGVPPSEWLSGLTDPVEIGRGGFGVVYRATETDLNRSVAVKILSGNLDDLAMQRFDRERRAMGALSGHPNIVAIYRSGVTGENRPYLVMEFLPGGSMAERIESRGPLEWQEAADVGVRLCAALETAHRAGVLHRDVKPENVFVSALGAPKLGDFGIARLEGAPQTQSAMITASLAHAAPELIDGKPPSVQSDVYGLASTIVTLMTGRPPFSRDTDESIVPLLARIATEPVPDLRHRGVPGAFCEVFERAMAKDRGARFASVADFGRALQDAQRATGVAVSPLEIQSVDPGITPGLGAPRAADPTAVVDGSASAPAATFTGPPASPPPAQPAPPTTPIVSPPTAPAATPVAVPAAYAPVAPATTGPAYPTYPGVVTGNQPPPQGANKGLVIGLIVAAVLVLAALAGLLLSGGGDDTAGGTGSSSTLPVERTTTTAEPTTTTTEAPPTTVPLSSVTTLEPGTAGVAGYTVTSIPFDLGDSDFLDGLAADCAAGDMEACDRLHLESPRGSRYEEFAAACGDRGPTSDLSDCVARTDLDT